MRLRCYEARRHATQRKANDAEASFDTKRSVRTNVSCRCVVAVVLYREMSGNYLVYAPKYYLSSLGLTGVRVCAVYKEPGRAAV